MKTIQVCSLVSLVWIATALAVEPPPDGGYANQNTAEGEDALFSLTIGGDNAAVGFHSLYLTTTGFQNTAIGSSTLESNTTGFQNTALGYEALQNATSGNGNIAVGVRALQLNSASGNVGVGTAALQLNTTGSFNIAVGSQALAFNTAGENNVAIGDNVMILNQRGGLNTAVGSGALAGNIQGNNNIALGQGAGKLIDGDNNISIGHRGHSGKSGQIIIGTKGLQTSTLIAGISGVTVAGGVEVVIDSFGNLGTITSSARYKEAIKPMKDASEVLLSLQPVTFRYKKDLDPQAIPQFGLVAEQVEKVDPDLVARDDEGKPCTVRYEAVNAMLLNEFLKEHRKGQEREAMLDELKATVAEQQKQIGALTASLREQAAQIQR